MKILHFAIFSFLVVASNAAMVMPTNYSEFDIAFYTCNGMIPYTATVCETKKKSLDTYCLCAQDSGFGTMSECLVKGYDNKPDIINGFIKTCKLVGIEMDQKSFYQNYTRTQKLLKDTSKIENFNKTKLIDYPVLLDFSHFKVYSDSYRFFLNNYNLSLWFGSALLAYWCIVLAIAAIVNWTIRFFPNITQKFNGPISHLYRRYITLSAAIHKKKSNHHHLGIFSLLVPSRMETVICTGFLAVVVATLSAQMKRVDGGSVMYVNKYGELARYLGDRTGIVISYAVPLLVLFAGRNNFLQWVTRWNFATFITYHRWVSRIVVLVVFIHAISFSIADHFAGKYPSRYSKPFMIWAMVAACCGGFILVQGLLFFRRRSYETFLIFHILFALFFIVGAYEHTVELGYAAFYWACIAIWAFDRAIRIFRILSFGAPKATVTILADETLRIVVPKPSYWKSIPGGHAFIHFLRPSCFWQSHPFTFTDSPTNKDAIVLYVKIKGGVTHGVFKYLLKQPGKTGRIRVCIEGPYGEPSGARHYKNSVFIAGGNGIPGIYSEAVDLSRKQIDRQSVKLIWIIREWKSLSWFYDELRRLNETKIDTTIFITKPDLMNGLEYFGNITTNGDNSSNEYEKKQYNEENYKEVETSSNDEDINPNSVIHSIKTELSHITFKEGRPNIGEIVTSDVSETDGSIAFVTCGHPVMVDDIRYSVIQNFENTKYRVEYFEQLQTWA